MRALLLLAFVAFTPLAASAQSEPALPSRLGAPARATLQSLADSLRREGLPHDQVAMRAAEGVLKQATDERIVAAARALAANLRAARATLGAGATRGELLAATDALRAGVPASLLQRVAATPRATDASGASLRTTALLVLVDLVTQRVPATTAADAVGSLLRDGATERRLLALRDAVMADVQRGESPAAAALARIRERSGPP